MKNVDLIGCGALNLDLLYRLPASFELSDQLPARGAEEGLDEETRAALDEALAEHEPFRSGGGQAANVVYALRRFGHQAVMLGRVGDDADGERLVEELGPEASQFLARSGSTGRVYVLLDEGGERRNLVMPGTNDQFGVADLPRRLPHARFAYFSSFVGDAPLAGQLALLERLPRDTDIAFDPGELYAAKGVKRFMPLLQQTTYLFATEHELELLCGVELSGAIEFLLNVGADTIVCKMGERGARLITRREEIYVPPSPASVVDVTGAGDLFAAGFLGGLLETLPLEAGGRLAAWTAARGIGGLGRSSYPDAAAWREQIELERSL